MQNQLITNAEALRLFFNDDVFLVKTEAVASFAKTTTSNQGADVVEAPKTQSPVAVMAPVMAKVDVIDLPSEPNFTFIGKNKKNILILVNDATNDISNEQGVLLLRNLIKAIGFKGDDFALVNYANYPTANFKQLQSFFKCTLLLSFGVGANELELNNIALHQLVNHPDTTMVFTNNLAVLASDDATKRTLWKNLQQLKND